MTPTGRHRGHSIRGRAGAMQVSADTSSHPLRKTTDYGAPISIDGAFLGIIGDRWLDPFLVANKLSLERLAVLHEIRIDPKPRVLLRPTNKIGALPLLNPSTRRVAGGILIEPRFRWESLGSVFAHIGFSVQPTLGRASLVPGSAREVPTWILAAPVIERIAGLLRHRRRGFQLRSEIRSSPRGTVNWGAWARHQIPRGDWTVLPCAFTEPGDDPTMMATIRWTLTRLSEELTRYASTSPGRVLLHRSSEMLSLIGPGLMLRPSSTRSLPAESEWISSAVEAMGWVADERGLGGSRSLNGLPWDLQVDKVWEAWVSTIAQDLGRRIGYTSSPFGGRRHLLQWQGPIRSMSSLLPDVELHGHDRVILMDAKYKAHLHQLAQKGWDGVSETIRSDHRADLHQALAYATLTNVSHVDTILVYPSIGIEDRVVDTIATVTSGSRSVRLLLLSLPFGFRSTQDYECHIERLRRHLLSDL